MRRHHRTGRLVTEVNRHLLSPEDLAGRQAAIEEYQAKIKAEPS